MPFLHGKRGYDALMNDDYYTKSDFKQYKKERKNKMPRNKMTKIRENQKPKNMRLSMLGRKIGENREKIKEMIAQFELLRLKVDELIALFPKEPELTPEELEGLKAGIKDAQEGNFVEDDRIQDKES